MLQEGTEAVRVLVCGAGADDTGALADRLRQELASSVAGRHVHIAALPGQVPDLRQLAEEAAVSDVAVLLADARGGIGAETRGLACLLSLFRVPDLVLAISHWREVHDAKDRFVTVASDFTGYADALGFEDVVILPLMPEDAVDAHMDWYRGPALSAHLEAVQSAPARPAGPLRLFIEAVRTGEDGEAVLEGTVASGEARAGDLVTVLPSGQQSRIAALGNAAGDLKQAHAGDPVTLRLADAVEVHAGDVIAATEAEPSVADQIAAHIVWMGAEPLLPGRPYDIACGAQKGGATITDLKHRIDAETLGHVAAKTLGAGEVGLCNLSIDRALVFDPFEENRDTGAFVLHDRISGKAVGAGMIQFGLRRATNIQWQALDIDKSARAALKGQRPCLLWFTGLSGAGKSTVASLLEKELHARGRHTYVLDGDNVRHGLNRDLGFTAADRVENIRRVAETAKLFVDAGMIVMASFISPFRAERRMARELFADEEFLEVFVHTPIEVCEQRDPKGLYKKARAGLVKNFTGIDSPYEEPENAEIWLEAGDNPPDQLVAQMIDELEKRGMI